MLNRIKAASLTTKVVSLALALLIVTVVTIFTVFISGYSDSAREGMVAKAAAFTAVADETKNHVSRLSSNGSFDHAKLLGDLQAQRDADPGYDYRDSDIYQTIPVVSGWTAGTGKPPSARTLTSASLRSTPETRTTSRPPIPSRARSVPTSCANSRRPSLPAVSSGSSARIRRPIRCTTCAPSVSIRPA
jgi:hypothetical protein